MTPNNVNLPNKPKNNSKVENTNSTSIKPKLSFADRAMNTFIGATLGLGMGGAVVATAGIAITLLAPAGMIVGVTGAQIFAIGALAFNLEAMVFAPFYSAEIDPIEWDDLSKNGG